MDWQPFQEHYLYLPDIGLGIDPSRMAGASAITELAPRLDNALDAVRQLEEGARANVDENRRVGHYWLRNPDGAPDDIGTDIRQAVDAVKQLAASVHAGTIAPPGGDGFYVVLWIGIGGSVLGPQLLADAAGTALDPLMFRFIDNTDPDGTRRVLDELDDALAQTLVVVVSKSGGTVETRNGMLDVAAAFRRAKLDFAKHAVAITTPGSELDRTASNDRWLASLPIWDFVGGRTSITSAVGLLVLALLGADVDAFLAGAAACDEKCRNRDTAANPAALLAAHWHDAARRGKRQMVILPYRDRLGLLGRYLQQLVMESLGKATDRGGRQVAEGITVLGNKGSTDQHALVQQLREGPDDFHTTIIGVRADDTAEQPDLGHGVTSGDCLEGFRLGTLAALSDVGREIIDITLDRLTTFELGVVVALFERAVSLYAELVNINAYNQPGVEAGKTSAAGILDLLAEIRRFLPRAAEPMTAEEVAAALEKPDLAADIFHLLEFAARNPRFGVRRIPGPSIFATRYGSGHQQDRP